MKNAAHTAGTASLASKIEGLGEMTGRDLQLIRSSRKFTYTTP